MKYSLPISLALMLLFLAMYFNKAKDNPQMMSPVIIFFIIAAGVLGGVVAFIRSRNKK